MKDNAHITISIDGIETRMKDPGAGKPALIADYGKLDDYIGMYQKHYDEKRAEFFDSTPEDADLPDKAKRWAAVSKTFMGLARTLMRAYGESDKYHQVSLEISDRIDVLYQADPLLAEAVRDNADYITGETLALSLAEGTVPEDWAQVSDEFDNVKVVVGLKKA